MLSRYHIKDADGRELLRPCLEFVCTRAFAAAGTRGARTAVPVNRYLLMPWQVQSFGPCPGEMRIVAAGREFVNKATDNLVVFQMRKEGFDIAMFRVATSSPARTMLSIELVTPEKWTTVLQRFTCPNYSRIFILVLNMHDGNNAGTIWDRSICLGWRAVSGTIFQTATISRR